MIVAHWKLNDNAASSTVLDTYNVYNGTYKNAGGALNTSTGSTAGKIGTCLDFDGTEYIDAGNVFQSTFQGDFSISIWFKATDGRPATSRYLCGSDSGDLNGIIYIVNATNGALQYTYEAGGNSANWASNVLLSDGQETWHHVVATADSKLSAVGGLKLYFDGSYVTPVGLTGNTSGITFADFASARNLYIGAEHTAVANGPFVGLIDNVMLFNSTLNADQIIALYNGGNGTEQPSVTDESRRIKRR